MKHASIINRGFTLLEILVVLTVIGTLVVISFPRYTLTIERSRAQQGEHLLLTLLGAQKRFFLENNNTYADNLAGLDIEPRSSEYFLDITDADISDTVDNLAQIQRRDGAATRYTLSVNQDGTIGCADGSQTGICTKLGY